ncbi:carboxyltransferase domain-containing protein [Gordonia oryzae]|uniref:Carboxyltransferase domain-containing protein n=1 Tax=Gordonia oryzae TaxID=2487349 RepID=A0A3N4GLB9_9ACTN|nr:carboxyltransferase domain-containing protein [Gordonia oryzae]RPA59881.1 carboxyltransferase domain-containing protein [Gordonia oryzae]
MNELPAGRDAVLLDFGDDPLAVRRAHRALRAAANAGDLPGVSEIVPSASTVLVQFELGIGADSLGIRRVLRGAVTDDDATPDTDDEVAITVTYDGVDLDAVATTLGCGVGDVVTAHTATRWRVQFMGFAPGFGYLVPEDADNPLLRIGRRAQPRTRVPAGAVSVAAGYSAIYPRPSPGGWQLLGRTSIRLWDETAHPPSLLAPGTFVRFVDAARGDTGEPR